GCAGARTGRPDAASQKEWLASPCKPPQGLAKDHLPLDSKHPRAGHAGGRHCCDAVAARLSPITSGEPASSRHPFIVESCLFTVRGGRAKAVPIEWFSRPWASAIITRR